jgi:hypothetical protein
MTAEQLRGILRALIAAAGGGLVSRGLITAENWDWILGGIAVIGPAFWSWYSKRPVT